MVKSTLLLLLAHQYRYYELSSRQMRFYRLSLYCSISINHKQTYTGITDRDRALTIKEMSTLYQKENPKQFFNSTFKTPGHVPLLIASNGLLSSRTGHTEMSVYLTQLANLSPITAICEMMDSETYSALSVDKAEKYAKENAIPFIDGKELLEFSKVN